MGLFFLKKFVLYVIVKAIGWKLKAYLVVGFRWIDAAVIQNVADPRRNGHIGNVFELAELRFRHDMERDISAFEGLFLIATETAFWITNWWFDLSRGFHLCST